MFRMTISLLTRRSTWHRGMRIHRPSPRMRGSHASLPHIAPVVPMSPSSSYLRRTYRKHKAGIRERLPEDKSRPILIDQCSKVVSEMDAARYFKESDGHFALAHLDLEPRSILVDQGSPPERPIITGILEWDTAVLSPAFMTCKPPTWIRNWKPDDEERYANKEPATAEKRVLKAGFEAAAGSRYTRFAHDPAYRLARRLVNLAIRGRWSGRDVHAVAILRAEWRDLLLGDAAKALAANDKT